MDKNVEIGIDMGTIWFADTAQNRYLLQGRTAEEVKRIIGNEYFVANVKEACEKGPRRLAFDVGIDAHRDGIEALEAVSKLIEDVEEGVNFVLSKSPFPLFPASPLSPCLFQIYSHFL